MHPSPGSPPQASLRAWALLLLLLLPGIPGAQSGVVINEVMYHPPDDRDEYQWIELWNTGPDPVDLAGWSFRKGLRFTFTNSTPLPPNGFLVISSDVVAFRQRYGTNAAVIGDFSGRLSHGGELIELAHRDGTSIDRVRYRDSEPWPTSPDGLSPSLERLLATGPGDDARNWEPSPLPETRRPAGTPGQPNANARTNPPPDIAHVQFGPATPGQPLEVTATVTDPDGLRQVMLAYRVLPPTPPQPGRGNRPSPRMAAVDDPPEVEIPMTASGNLHSASLPAQPEGHIVRFRIRAVDTTGSQRILPHPHDARPAWTVYFGRLPGESRIPQVALLQQGPPEPPGRNLNSEFQRGPNRRTSARGTPSRGESILLYQPPGSDAPQVFDFIRITPRNAGWKVRLHKDRPLEQMSTVNVIFEYQPRFVLSEHLAYELFRSTGHPTPLSGHWRITHNGRPAGYHLFVEQPNSTFLRRVGLDDSGDLFKILWYGHDLISQHEKKNNPQTGHAFLVDTVESLAKPGPATWGLIQERFEIEAAANYFAVSQCIQNWDGFFNNHFLYRQPGPSGKWQFIPWDLDKTWGDFDGASAKYDWYSMPLTYGMAGDQPPRGFGGIHGGPAWWRRGGWFSSPLLANPQFRTRFLSRLQELCRAQFTPEALEPILAGLEQRLEPEVRHRASLFQGDTPGSNGWTSASEMQQADPDAAAAQLRRHIASFRNQTLHRREFLLRELAKAGVK